MYGGKGKVFGALIKLELFYSTEILRFSFYKHNLLDSFICALTLFLVLYCCFSVFYEKAGSFQNLMCTYKQFV